MCGLVGAFALKPGQSVDQRAIERLTDQLAHRGPDDRGLAHRAGFSCGHRRLMITDPLSRSAQPFWDNTGEVMVAFNGEIYNHGELRELLREHGAQFRTASDTEVVVEAYKHWGTACLSRLNGMFAFAVYDQRTQALLLARDRLGVKPLYYGVFDDLLLFGSEINAVAGYPKVRKQLDPKAIVRFLRFRYVPFGEQYYRGLQKLPPGCFMHVAAGKVTLQTYWDLPADRNSVDLNPASLSCLIERSVKSEVCSDSRTALLLSGGVDSSILAFHMRSIKSSAIAAFTAQLPGTAYDESAIASRIASSLGLEHRIVPISTISNLDETRRLICIKGQPLGMHNELAMAELARSVVKYSKVVLCGEGGDELFAGYARMFRFPFVFSRPSMKFLASRPEWKDGDDGWVPDHFWKFVLANYFYLPSHDLEEILRPDLKSLCIDSELADWVENTSQRFFGAGRFQQIAYFFLKLHLPGLLEMIDSATMSASLEARVPYTDHHLVEAAFALPENRRLRWRSPIHAALASVLPLRLWSERCDTPKAILYDAYHQQLSRKIFRQRKKGFPIPLGAWLSRNKEVCDLILAGNSPLHEFFSPAKLRAWYLRGAAKPNDTFGRRLWLLANLGLFLEGSA